MKKTNWASKTSSDLYEQEILDGMDRLILKQIIDFFTTKRNILDLEFVNDPDYVDAARIHSEFLNSCVKSFHFRFPITFTVSLLSTRHDFQSSQFLLPIILSPELFFYTIRHDIVLKIKYKNLTCLPIFTNSLNHISVIAI